MDEIKLIRQCAKDAMFDIRDDEMDDMIKAYRAFIDDVTQLEKIDTTFVEALYTPYDLVIGALREDEVLFERVDISQNAPEMDDDYIVVSKVISS